jgi:ADP-ribose pyrophosphatase YjhB (NUDIX family)
MNYCSDCGNPVGIRIPDGDSRERHVCDHCGTIHYQNPRIIAGTLPFVGDKVLLCRRAIEPRLGFWTLPAGFMENGETTPEAAARETLEEADARVMTPELYAIFNLPHINQVYIFFRAGLVDGRFGAGPESLESRLFSEEEIPWDDLAFPTVYRALRFYFEDRKSGHYPVRVEDIRRPPGGGRKPA